MVGFAPRDLVEPPALVPVRFGLLSAADVVTHDDPHWQNGLKAIGNPCGEAHSYADTCPPVADRTKDVDDGVPIIGADPFTVYGGFKCAPVGFTQEEIQSRAATALSGGEGRTVEATVWTGQAENGESVFPFFGNATPQPSYDFDVPVFTDGGTGADFSEAIGLMEEALGDCYGGIGVIHIPARYSPEFDHAGIRQVGDRLETALGTRVVVGRGYPADGAGDFLFGTGAVAVHRSAPRVVGSFRSSIDREVNTVLYLVERTYAVTWDCCTVRVTVT